MLGPVLAAFHWVHVLPNLSKSQPAAYECHNEHQDHPSPFDVDQSGENVCHVTFSPVLDILLVYITLPILINKPPGQISLLC